MKQITLIVSEKEWDGLTAIPVGAKYVAVKITDNVDIKLVMELMGRRLSQLMDD